MVDGIGFFYGVTHSYGLAIIGLTIVVRMLLLPLTVKQMQAMRKMQVLAPEQKRLQAKHKDDPAKLNQAIMELWRENEVNPMAGCLPMVVQLPLLWALYDGLRGFHYAHSSAFLWLSSLSAKDHFYILPILAGVTTFFQSRMVTPPNIATDAATKQTQMITMWGMPLILMYVSLQFPAGLSLYWVVSNLIAIVQQYLMIRRPPVTGRVQG